MPSRTLPWFCENCGSLKDARTGKCRYSGSGGECQYKFPAPEPNAEQPEVVTPNVWRWRAKQRVRIEREEEGLRQ